eukprot:Rmarinus@m.18842
MLIRFEDVMPDDLLIWLCHQLRQGSSESERDQDILVWWKGLSRVNRRWRKIAKEFRTEINPRITKWLPSYEQFRWGLTMAPNLEKLDLGAFDYKDRSTLFDMCVLAPRLRVLRIGMDSGMLCGSDVAAVVPDFRHLEALFYPYYLLDRSHRSMIQRACPTLRLFREGLSPSHSSALASHDDATSGAPPPTRPAQLQSFARSAWNSVHEELPKVLLAMFVSLVVIAQAMYAETSLAGSSGLQQ